MIIIKYLDYLKYIGIYLLTIILFSFIFSALSLLDVLNLSITNILVLVIPALILLILSYKIGKKTSKKGYIEGLLFGVIIIIITILLSIIFFEFKLDLKNILFYLILIISTTLGGMFGKIKKITN